MGAGAGAAQAREGAEALLVQAYAKAEGAAPPKPAANGPAEAEDPGDPEQNKALIFAATRGDEDGVLVALQNGASPDAVDESSADWLPTALMRIAQNNRLSPAHIATFSRLLAAGANPSKQDKSGEVAAKQANAKDTPQHEMLLTLLGEHGCPKAKQHLGARLGKACSENNATRVQELLHAGAVAGANDQLGNTGLKYCCRSGHLQCLELLLKAKADVNAKDQDGTSYLMHASYAGELECVNALLAAGAEVAAENPKGETAADFGAFLFRKEQKPLEGPRLDCVRRLLEAGDPHAAKILEDAGQTAAQAA